MDRTFSNSSSRSWSSKSSSTSSRRIRSTSSKVANDEVLWQDKYKPKTVKDVVVHHSKKKAVLEWISRTKVKADFQNSLPTNSPNYKPSVLVLCGCSGSCKSTLLEVAAKEQTVRVVEWHEDMLEGGATGEFSGLYNPFISAQEYAESAELRRSGTHSTSVDSHRWSKSKEQMMDELNDFALRSAYSSLQFISSTRKQRTANRVHSSSTFNGRISLDDGNDGFLKAGSRKRNIPSNVIDLVSDEEDGKEFVEDIDDFEIDNREADSTLENSCRDHVCYSRNPDDSKLLKRSDSVRSSSSSSSSSSGYDNGCSIHCQRQSASSHQIILIHDPSSLMTSDQKSSLGRKNAENEGIGAQLLKFRHPVVLIVSDMGEREAAHWAVNDMIPKAVQECIDLEVIYCTPITVINIKKVLKHISVVESSQYRLNEKRQRRMIAPTDEVLEGIATSSLGDLRQAIAQLQLYMLGHSCSSVSLRTGFEIADSNPDPEAGSRDKSYSFLHGIGKLLWAKVSTSSIVSIDEGRHPDSDGLISLYKLQFPPDSVIHRLELPIDMAMSFLQFNYMSIFEQMDVKNKSTTSVHGLEKSSFPLPAFDSMDRAERFAEMLSQADMLHACQFSTNLPLDRAESSSFPKEYVESICSRAAPCSMFPVSKTSVLFKSYNDSRRQLSRSVQERSERIGDSYDHLTGTHGGLLTLKKTTSTRKVDKSDSSRCFGLTAIRRPTSLDVKKQSSLIADMTRDLRAALVSFTAQETSTSYTASKIRHSHPLPSTGLKSLQSFDYIVKQSAHSSSNSNFSPIVSKDGGAVQDEERSLPVSFLTSTELITVVIPYLKCLLAMSGSSLSHPLPLHPCILKHITAMIGSTQIENDDTDSGVIRKQNVLIGRSAPDLHISSNINVLGPQHSLGGAESNRTQNGVIENDEVNEFSD